jgi:hypothetical protein
MSIELASVCIIQKDLSNCLLFNKQTTMGGLDGTSSSWSNQNEPNWLQTEPNQPGHDYMTPNATTSQHGGFIQPEPSFPPLRYPIFHI